RVKRLGGESALRAFQGYRHYTGDGHGHQSITRQHPIPWPLVSGEVVYDKLLELDNEPNTSRRIDLNWNEILGAEQASALLFVSIEGTPKKGLGFHRNRLTQFFLQLSDIGLAWKLTEDTAFLYLYSCDTGQPLANVQLDVFGEDATVLQGTRTNRDGVARLPRNAEQRQLRASLGTDAVIVNLDAGMPTVSMWRFPVRTQWIPDLPSHRTALLFTDRNLYRPGEEVHLKGIVRRIKDNR
ncbi:MAG: hypothetical protein GWO24_08240, partial [Akkermansiaceae bacterium]|nr:hypothetical protein [Akkermansiaceae bacterium]